MYQFISCQTFAGGFDLGLVQSGMKMIHKVEQVGGFGMKNCLANRHLLGNDWADQSCDYNAWEVMPADMVAANPPCS